MYKTLTKWSNTTPIVLTRTITNHCPKPIFTTFEDSPQIHNYGSDLVCLETNNNSNQNIRKQHLQHIEKKQLFVP